MHYISSRYQISFYVCFFQSEVLVSLHEKVFLFFIFFYKLYLNIDNLVQIEENSKNHYFSKKM